MRVLIKRRVFGVSRRVGVSALVRDSRWRRQRLSILCYHGVSIADEHEAAPWLYIPAALLRRRLEQLRAGRYHVLPLGDALARLAAGTLPPRSVALTFDDGTRDFALQAVPLLEEFAAPATVYPTTYYADRGQPVFDTALMYVLWRGRAARCRWAAFAGAEAPGLATAAARVATAAAIQGRAAADGLDANAKDGLLRRVAERLGVDYDAILDAGLFQVMSAEQMRALPRPLVDVQLHTHRHRVPADPGLLAREIADNRAYFAHAGVESSGVHFCYPNGTYTAAAARQLPRLGLRSATTCDPGLAGPGANPFTLPRFVDNVAVGDATFEAWVSGVAQFAPRRRARPAPDAPAGGAPAAAVLLDGLGLPPQEVHEHELA